MPCRRGQPSVVAGVQHGDSAETSRTEREAHYAPNVPTPRVRPSFAVATFRQVDQIKSPRVPTPRRSFERHDYANRREPAAQGKYETPPAHPRENDDGRQPGGVVAEQINWATGGRRHILESATPQAIEMPDGEAVQRGDGGGRRGFRHRRDDNPPAVAGGDGVEWLSRAKDGSGLAAAPGHRPGDTCPRAAALLRCNSQQSKLLAAAAAIETAAAVVANIPEVSNTCTDVAAR